jgi:hypothetical protein
LKEMEGGDGEGEREGRERGGRRETGDGEREMHGHCARGAKRNQEKGFSEIISPKFSL